MAQIRRRRRLTLEVLWVCTIALVPWAIYLGVALPHEYSTRHWDIAWAGFDGLEIIALGATTYFAWRGRQALIASALAAATLLICDAWFDISLDLGTPAIWTSLTSAVFLELPLAASLIRRVRLLLRITLMQLFPEGDEDGRPMSLVRLPLLFSLLRDSTDTTPDMLRSTSAAHGERGDDPSGRRRGGESCDAMNNLARRRPVGTGRDG